MKDNKQAGTVVCVALTAFNKSSINDLMMQKAVADRIHTLVGDVVPSNAVVSQVSALLADHSQCYDTSGKPRSDLFVVDANPNISVFDLLMTYSLLRVLGKHGSPLPLVAELDHFLMGEAAAGSGVSVNYSCQATHGDGKSIRFSRQILSREAKRPRTESRNG
jgi:hypothetical protein